MDYDLILEILAGLFPVMGCILFALFWAQAGEDYRPDPIYAKSQDVLFRARATRSLRDVFADVFVRRVHQFRD
jgi:hypothetical protein